MKPRKVKSARLHTSIYIAGIGDLGPSLPPKNKTIVGFAMVATDEGLEVFGSNEESFVPWANVQCVTYEAQAKDEEKWPQPKAAEEKPSAKPAVKVKPAAA